VQNRNRATGKSPEPAGWKACATWLAQDHDLSTMNESVPSRRVLRFGVFEVDLTSQELHKTGLKIRLRGQPFQVLAMLLEQAGDVVTRDELQRKLSSDGTFVDFDHSLVSADS